MRNRVVTSSLVEEISDPHHARLLAFGIAAFAPGSLAEEILALPTPYFGSRIVLESASRLQDWRHVRDANSDDGLCLLLLHAGWENDLAQEDIFQVLQHQNAAFQKAHWGYQLKMIICERASLTDIDLIEATGMKVVSRYEDWFLSHDGVLPVPEKNPFLACITRPQAIAGPACSSPECSFFLNQSSNILERCKICSPWLSTAIQTPN